MNWCRYFVLAIITALAWYSSLFLSHSLSLHSIPRDFRNKNALQQQQQQRSPEVFMKFDKKRPSKKYMSRRNILTHFVVITSTVAVTEATRKSSTANAFPFASGESSTHRRQLELCLVNLIRVLYWAQYAAELYNDPLLSFEARNLLCLETRLAAKAMLTGKLGDGSTGKVYSLSSLQIIGCFNDLEWYATTQRSNKNLNPFQIQQIVDNKNILLESLASLVEFDGFDSLQDPSPRASLTLAQYNDTKFIFMKRTLNELVIPYSEKLVESFGIEPLQMATNYIQQYYRSEIYKPKPRQEEFIKTVMMVDANKQEEGDAIDENAFFDGSY